MIGNTLLASKCSGGSLEEVGELGPGIGIELEEGVTEIGITRDEGKFMVT